MASEWKETRLGDLISVEHGFAFKGDDFSEKNLEGPIVVTIGNFDYAGGFRFGSTRLKRCSSEYPSEYELKAGDILLAMTCQTSGGEILGIPGVIPNDDEIYLHNQRLGKVVLKANDVCAQYLYWLFLSKGFNHHLCTTATGTKILHTAPKRIENYEFACPPLPEQKAIAHILGSLDDKIELNRRMNETLEGMAQALFKSWFVDFDPVIDNALAAGNPIPEEFAGRAETRRQVYQAEGMALADFPNIGKDVSNVRKLFPDSFHPSELGPIPEGWEVRSIESIAEKIAMGPFGSRITRNNFVENGVPVIRGGNLTKGFVDRDFVYLTEEKAAELQSSTAFPGDIVFTHRGTIGQVGIIPSDSEYPRYVVSQSQMFLRINPEVTSAEYVFRHFKSGSGMGRLLGHASQVGVPAIARPTTSLKSLPILVPKKSIVTAFDEVNASYVNKANANGKQNENLTNLRDTLLSKLISGELRLEGCE